MEKTLQVLNALEHDGIFRRYAIGGAMAATFYAEPVLTFDLAVFVLLPPAHAAGGLLSPAPLYEGLRRRSYVEEGECVLIEGVPVQFLPAYNTLIEEALTEARETLYERTPTRVLRAEHVAAIAVQTGREKDRQRVRLLTEQVSMDSDYLSDVLARHGLEGKWKQWTPRLLKLPASSPQRNGADSGWLRFRSHTRFAWSFSCSGWQRRSCGHAAGVFACGRLTRGHPSGSNHRPSPRPLTTRTGRLHSFIELLSPLSF
jgi:hypothetical protein